MRFQTKLMVFISLLVLVVTGLLGLSFRYMITSALYEEMGKRALTVANTLAVDAQVRDALEQTNTTQLRSRLSEAVKPVQASSGADFITIADRHLIRQWHVNPERIGTPMIAPMNGKVLQGHSFITESTGSLGRSLRAKTAVYDEQGKAIGLISVGFLMTDVEQNIRTYTYAWLWFMVGALTIGISGSLLIARRVRRELHGLEPVEIGRLYQEKQAILESIGEGIIAVNSSGQVTLANPQAVRLLGLTPETTIDGCELRHLPGAAGKLADVLVAGFIAKNTSIQPDQEQLVFHEENGEIEIQQRVVVVNRVPLKDRSGQIMGTVASLRDKTELLRMTRQLTEVKDYAEVLRSQTHEYTNRLYLISGLIQLECYDEAVDFITQESEQYRMHRTNASTSLPDSIIASLLIGKKKQAQDKGIVLHSTVSGVFSTLSPALEWSFLAAMAGNLLDNAMEAVAMLSIPEGQVWFRLEETAQAITVEVADNGSGISEDIREKLFVKGASTKTEAGHGYGLALVHEYAERMGGSIQVHERTGGGTIFEIRIPLNTSVMSDEAKGGYTHE
ncbi:sensor histidine kinase [Paenibacillus peoriae]|uniref:ATP-binding protein n=1 Tax=Paenibacillus peoriae TaxID=59893 RepID=UPI00026C5ECC|nr:sensor histidine kinase [Paenibacillus peoriae]MEC0179910.1 sensor histidine kinase [Paenibacillus peoriae]